jgi:butyrate kinase
MKSFRVLVANPDSTSTKVAVHAGATALRSGIRRHGASELGRFARFLDRLESPSRVIEELLGEHRADPKTTRVSACRGEEEMEALRDPAPRVPPGEKEVASVGG